ncbi:PASTA domain-containing protein [Cryptosporangium aurantiacum]|uniref:PASTA domain-containing protein n=1 Tax=Cryptosporangium aurantiacum TaxID=134849 RepID=A0A1M7KDQ1_9ACTN|nr:PASTA domain-containing protein [Cryptosporangium aurantiacum]SHM63329.1 PASTA domain-containing protein [Cryptosporangium aurantiacum]
MSSPNRFPRPQTRGPWLLAVVMLIVLALCCFAGLLISIAQQGGESTASPAATSAPPASGERLVVPNVTDQRLPDAEQRLKALGFDDPRVVDATGRGRVVVSRQNWIVRAQEPAAGSRVDRSAEITLRVSKPTDSAPTDVPSDGVIPDVVCRDLQSAQDALQAAGFYVLASVDGSGQGRRQLVDRNWVVVEQSVAAGSRPARSTRVLLTVVKIGEPTDRCPG